MVHKFFSRSFIKSRTFDFVKNIVSAKVTVAGEKNTFEVFTDENGRYALWDLPVGKYRIEAEYPSDYALSVTLFYGAGDYRKINENGVETNSMVIEAATGMCGGASFFVDLKENLTKRD